MKHNKNTSSNKKNKYLLFYYLLFLIFTFILICIIPNDLIIFVVIKVILMITIGVSFIVYIMKKQEFSEGIKKEKLKNNKIKFKYEPLKLSIDEIKFWLENAEIPDTIYIKSKNNEYFMIEVWFDTDSRMGPFYNKTIWFDGEEIETIEEIINLMKLNQLIDIDGMVEISATTELNDPIYFEKVLSELKESVKQSL